MISKTKYKIDNPTIETLFHAAGIPGITSISPLGAGEYNAVFAASANGKDYVLKIAPTDDIPVLTYEKNMMDSEVHWYTVMREQSPIAVPEIYFSDFRKKLIPTKYFIMEKLQGQPLDKIELSKEEKADSAAATARMAAQMHKIKNDRFGYIQNQMYDDWYQAIHAMVSAVLADCARKGKSSRRGEQLLACIDHHKSVLQKAECCMVNFDIWPSNIIAKRENGALRYAWIDPERSYWGDPMVDFVCLEMMTPLAGKKISLAAYNKETDCPVQLTREAEIRYAVAQGYLAVIMEVEKYFRYTPRHFGWWRNVGAAAALYSRSFGVLKNG